MYLKGWYGGLDNKYFINKGVDHLINITFPDIYANITKAKIDKAKLILISTVEESDTYNYIFNRFENRIIEVLIKNDRPANLSDFRKLFSERFKVYLYSKGITMQDLTDKTGISKKTLYNYLEGKTNPSLMNIYKIANALDLDMSDLV